MPRTARGGLASVNIMQEATTRDFSGGLDVADSELNLTSKYARVLDNLVVGLDGTLDVRQGTKLFADLYPQTSYEIINMQFFYRYILPVTARGEVFAVDGTGTPTAVWNPAIAGALRPGLTIWPSADFVVFGE